MRTTRSDALTAVPSEADADGSPHLYPDSDDAGRTASAAIADFAAGHPARRWVPRRVLITPAARAWEHGRAIADRARAAGAEIVELTANRLTGLRETDPVREYALAKTTLAIVVSPPGQRRLQPIPPSADWQFHLAEGCPAHCQYCYLAGSLAGPPITRIYANLPEILDGLRAYAGTGSVTSQSIDRAAEGTTFESSCYTDPLALEHLSGGLAQAITFFGAWDAHVQLRWTTKFDDVETLLPLAHNRKTRIRFSVNAQSITRTFEGGTAPLRDRITALGRVARAGYPVGLTIAPIMPLPEWRAAYAGLLDAIAREVDDISDLDLTAELITHRFTPGSKDVLMSWYPKTKLEMDEAARSQKRTKFGSTKFVYRRDVMAELKAFFYAEIARRLPTARVLYWT